MPLPSLRVTPVVLLLLLALAVWAGRRLERYMGPSLTAFRRRRAHEAHMREILKTMQAKDDALPRMPLAEAMKVLEDAEDFDPSMGDDGFDPLRLLVGNALSGDAKQVFTLKHGRLLDRLLREHHSPVLAKFADL